MAMKNWVNLWCALFSVMLPMLATGSEINAVSYWNRECNTLYDQGNYTGASDCWKKAIELGNQTNAPIFTEITTQCSYRMYALDKNNSTQKKYLNICAGPISIVKGQSTPDSEGITLSFDVTNPDSMDMRIGNIYVNVIEYSSIVNPNIIHKFSVRKTIGNLCNIEPSIDSYKCKTLLNDTEYIYLAPTTSEHFAINVNTDMPGIYQLRIDLDYAIGRETKRCVVGDVPEIIGFFNKSMLQSAELGNFLRISPQDVEIWLHSVPTTKDLLHTDLVVVL
jgi:hypothetical protein